MMVINDERKGAPNKKGIRVVVLKDVDIEWDNVIWKIVQLFGNIYIIWAR